MEGSGRALLTHSQASRSNCFVFATFLFRLLFLDIYEKKNVSSEMFIKETNLLAFCLSNMILGLLHGRPFFVYRSGNALPMPRTLLMAY